MAHLDHFMQTYETLLTGAVKATPARYTYSVECIPYYVAKMREAVQGGTFSLRGETIQATCKQLGITPRYKAIKAYINSQEV